MQRKHTKHFIYIYIYTHESILFCQAGFLNSPPAGRDERVGESPVLGWAPVLIGKGPFYLGGWGGMYAANSKFIL